MVSEMCLHAYLQFSEKTIYYEAIKVTARTAHRHVKQTTYARQKTNERTKKKLETKQNKLQLLGFFPYFNVLI